jgi:predicted DNA-binding mobile mystery protein A
VLKMANSSKIREQLEDVIQAFAPLKGKRPFKGWIRTLREALGMSGRQLAERIQVESSRIPEMEKAEAHGNITLKSLRRAAEAMGCEVVYAFIPIASLDASLREQAEKAAKRKLASVAHTMKMEGQGLSEKENAKQISTLVEEWMEDPPRWLWDSL